MQIPLSFLKRAVINPFSLLLIVANFGAMLWMHFFKPRVSGFVYDYSEEPTYFKVFKTINVVPDSITGLVFYPIDHGFSLEHHLQLQSAIFDIIFLIFASIQWMLIGFAISEIWRSMSKPGVQ